MTCSRRDESLPQWPFWLLLAAWICANSPQTATFAVLTWLDEARNFSHQHRLTLQTALILAGEKAPETVGSATTDATPRPMPAVPSNVVLKKIELACELAIEVLPPSSSTTACAAIDAVTPPHFRSPPLHGPPRVQSA